MKSPIVRQFAVSLAGLAILVMAVSPVPVEAEELIAVCEALAGRMERLRADRELKIGTASVAALTLLPAVYEKHHYERLWARQDRMDMLIEAIRSMPVHGLDPADYHLEELLGRFPLPEWQEVEDPGACADLDILLTDSLARMAYHLYYGKVDPEELSPEWNFSRKVLGEDPVITLIHVVETGLFLQALEQAAPQADFYHRLQQALVQYRRIEDAGGWPMVPDGDALKPGMTDDRVLLLRKRLALTGDLPLMEAAGSEVEPVKDAADEPSTELATDPAIDPAAGHDATSTVDPDPEPDTEPVPDPTRYDKSLEAAVIAFQERHGLAPDGVVGKKTFTALNVPVGARVDQIRANLERSRWVAHNLEDDFVLVDIAGFRLHLIRDGQELWSTRVQVGKPYHRTPVFKAAIDYMVLNPTWNVPPGILAREVLPKVKEDQAYLTKENMSVVDAGGRRVDPASIDWASVTHSSFGYGFRQESGGKNALGRVKFIFPNPHMVYLHDTPSKRLFDRTERAFSHGCIRTENPLRLAELLFEEHPYWNAETIGQELASRRTKTIYLEKPMTVMLLYWTAEVVDGKVRFRKDIYGRDQRVIDGLADHFVFRPPRGTPEWLMPQGLEDRPGGLGE